LEIGVDQVNSLLEEFRRSSQEPIEVECAQAAVESGEAIPPRATASRSNGFALHQAVLRRLMAETEQVAEMLGAASRAEDAAEQAEQPSIWAPARPCLAVLADACPAFCSTLLRPPGPTMVDFDFLATAC